MRLVTQADGFAEREAAKVMIRDAHPATASPDVEVTLGADQGYNAPEFVQACQDMGVIPHVAQNTSGRRSAVPDAIAASEGYALSQRKRKLIEQGFGWAKTVGGIRQVMVRGLKRVDHLFVLTMTAYNLTRMRFLRTSPSAGALRQSEDRKIPSNQRNGLAKSLLTALYEKRVFTDEIDAF
jgi:hypothetical protein